MAAHPGLFGAAVLTGVNYNTSVINTYRLVWSFVPRVASLQNAHKFSELDTGYIFQVSVLRCGLGPLIREITNPFTFTEFETLIDGDLDASSFTGPAMAGKNDYVVCDGECEGIFDVAARAVFKNAKPVLPYLHPHSRHNINFHRNAGAALSVIADFLGVHL
ncbi:hypothetical protein F5B21DRAFT_506366 [Xylaria acuta]|nr:hypothetical protein F5B21DRAFT_506366 [Xylaria acuta]